MLKILFTDFPWHSWEKDGVFNKDFLSKFNLLPCQKGESPDIVIFSHFGLDFKKYNCLKIFYSAENLNIRKPPFILKDFYNSGNYSITMNTNNHSNNFRMPNYIRKHGFSKLLELTKNNLNYKKTKFCAFVSSHQTQERLLYLEKLQKIDKVDCFGTINNNMGTFPKSYGKGIELLLKDYKFCFSFENSKASGYSTEKIFEPMLSNCIPIYWGDPDINNDFNINSFVNINDILCKKNLDYIEFLHTNDSAYETLQQNTFFKDNVIPSHLREEKFDIFFKKILKTFC